MRSNRAFTILLFSFCFFTAQSERSFGQAPGSGKLFGVPICTGFYLKLDTSAVHKRINKLEQSADSLRKEAMRLQDSLLHQQMPTFGIFGEEFQKQWKLQVPHDLHFPFNVPPELQEKGLIPHLEVEPPIPHSPFYYTPPNNIERMPSPKIEPFQKEEKKNPIRDFKGWYYEKLADISK